MRTNRNYTRPGVVAAARLVSLLDAAPPSRPDDDDDDDDDDVVPSCWDAALSRYDDMLFVKGGSRLVDLNGRMEGLPTSARSRLRRGRDEGECAAVLTRGQLLDVIVEWKFLRGKPRHALWSLLRSNSNSIVESASRLAYDALANGVPVATEDDIDDRRASAGDGDGSAAMSNAMGALCELRGVGPATASAVLSLHRPDLFVYMDDEVIECLYDGKRGYTRGIYAEVNDRCADIARRLNAMSRGGRGGSKGGGGEAIAVVGRPAGWGGRFGRWRSCPPTETNWVYPPFSIASTRPRHRRVDADRILKSMTRVHRRRGARPTDLIPAMTP